MKLAITKNNGSAVIAELSAEGYLGAHFNLRQDSTGIETGAIRINGHDVTNRESTKFLKWTSIDIVAGDVIRVEIEPDLTPTIPEEIAYSDDYKNYNNLSLHQAKSILQIVDNQTKELNQTLEMMRDKLEEDDFKTLAHSIGHILATYLTKIKTPIYRCHPILVPEELQNLSL